MANGGQNVTTKLGVMIIHSLYKTQIYICTIGDLIMTKFHLVIRATNSRLFVACSLIMYGFGVGTYISLGSVTFELFVIDQ